MPFIIPSYINTLLIIFESKFVFYIGVGVVYAIYNCCSILAKNKLYASGMIRLAETNAVTQYLLTWRSRPAFALFVSGIIVTFLPGGAQQQCAVREPSTIVAAGCLPPL